MRADEPHRLAGRRAHRRQAEAAHDRVEDRLRRLARMDDPGGDAERPGRGRNQHGRGSHLAVEPAAGGELVLDQAVGGRGVGHAQQRLGQHHQRQALLGGERIGVQQILDAAEARRPGADRLDQPARARVDAALRGGRGRLRQENRGQFLVRRRVRRSKRRHHSITPVHNELRSGGGDTASYCATSTIQPTPNLSATMPKRGEKNVFVIGMFTLPPSDSAANTCRLRHRCSH